MKYQDFDGTGSSKSNEKLAALDLSGLARRRNGNRNAPLANLAVLDIGCNEGFFCIEAVRQGAKRVVGIDANADVIASAKKRCPQAEFLQTGWWNLPNEKFDVIFFLSSMHYEPNIKKYFSHLSRYLNPSGTLILECGVATANGIGEKAWHTVHRWDGPKRYPTSALLIHELLSDYAVRPIGKSVLQAGDPVPRTVYHCEVKAPTALLVSGSSGQGKTVLSTSLEQHGIPNYSTDALLLHLLRDERYEWRTLAKKLRSKYPTDNGLNLGLVAMFIDENKLQGELSDIIVAECPSDAMLFCIQGDVLRHDAIRADLVAKLKKKGIRSWHVGPN
jgi:SAM-dependent methyltransferase